MPLSRLRLRLAGWFALAFLAGLLVLSVTLFWYTHWESSRRFVREAIADAREMADAVRIEYAEAPAGGVTAAVAAVEAERPAHLTAFAVYDREGRRIGLTGPASLAEELPARLPARSPARPRTLGARAADVPGSRVRLVSVESDEPPFSVVVAASTARLDAETTELALWLAGSVPVTVLLSLVAGYVLSRRALRPVSHLEHAIGRIAPEALDRRLPVSEPPDELDRLAARVNALLERLEESQTRNGRFLEQAAHQIRTPLTLVLGEAELALAESHSTEGRGDALRRIRLAAGQMRGRIEELLLLARASAGERAPLTDAVELDGLALECADLMRGRAQALGARLELDRVEPIVVMGSEPLLREAIVELLENACRHGGGGVPVRLSVSGEDGRAVVEVTNQSSGAAAWASDEAPGHGLGLQVVRWVASQHGGLLLQRSESGQVRSRLLLPASTPQP